MALSVWNGDRTQLSAPRLKGYNDAFKPLVDNLTRLQDIENKKKELSEGRDFLVQRETWKNNEAIKARDVDHVNRVNDATTLNDRAVANAKTRTTFEAEQNGFNRQSREGISSADNASREKIAMLNRKSNKELVASRGRQSRLTAKYSQTLKNNARKSEIAETNNFLKSLNIESKSIPTKNIQGSDIQVFDQKTYMKNISKDKGTIDKESKRIVSSLNKLPDNVRKLLTSGGKKKDMLKKIEVAINSAVAEKNKDKGLIGKGLSNITDKSDMMNAVEAFYSGIKNVETLTFEIGRKKKTSTRSKKTYNTVPDYMKNSQQLNGEMKKLEEAYAIAPTKIAKDIIKVKLKNLSGRNKINSDILGAMQAADTQMKVDTKDLELEKNKIDYKAEIASNAAATKAYNKAHDTSLTVSDFLSLPKDDKE